MKYDELSIKNYDFLNDESKKASKKERVKRGFCDMDIYDMDEYMLTLIPNMLRRFAEMSIGYPDGSCKSMEEWKNKVISVAEKFEAIREDAKATYENPCKSAKELQAGIKDAFDSLADIYFSLWV